MFQPTEFLSGLLSTLLDRTQSGDARVVRRPMRELCGALMSSRGEVSGVRLAKEVLARYRIMTEAERLDFFRWLTEDMDLDTTVLAQAVAAYGREPTLATLAAVTHAAEPRRRELLRRLNQAPDATNALVRMRLDLLTLTPQTPEIARADLDFVKLFETWFNRGFLVLRPINWRSPANVLEKIIDYEAVHAIHGWGDLRRRLEPPDRRCFAFFHPAMPEEPLIFVEVALAEGIPGSIQALLSADRAPMDPAHANTAVFYSISNCQEGLRGISFGNSLIKQVVEELSHELPHLANFVTLSPIPGLSRWLRDRPEATAVLEAAEAGDLAALAEHGDDLRHLAALYLLEARRVDGLPLDPVARFHLGNGALVHDVHALADTARNGLAQSCGVMVNYLYERDTVEENHESFASRRVVVASKAMRALLKPKAKPRRP